MAYREDPSSVFRVWWQEIGDKTNNEAEYHALLKALSIIRSKRREASGGDERGAVGPVKIYSDSELIVKQVRGEYDVKDRKLRDLRDKARQIMEGTDSITLEWIPREQNYAGLWLENKWAGGKVEVKHDP